jgi:hypothetical protein
MVTSTNRDATGKHSLYHGVRLACIVGAQHGNETNAFDDLLCGFGHVLLYRAMRAEPPLMTRSTSANVVMLVSPGVVMARAPCATPQVTAHSMGLAASSP